MPSPKAKADVHGCLDNSCATTEMALLSLRTEDLSFRLEEMKLQNSMAVAQHHREKEAKETEILRCKAEFEKMRMQFEEDAKVREHAEEMRRMEMEAINQAREHELKAEVQETLRLKLELAKANENIEKLKNENHLYERKHKERMAKLDVERLQLFEQQKIQRRKEEEQDTRSLRNLGFVATGVGAASGAIGGVLGTTATVGLAAGMVAGAATVLAPVSGAVALASGVGYVYKKATASN